MYVLRSAVPILLLYGIIIVIKLATITVPPISRLRLASVEPTTISRCQQVGR